MFLKSRLLQIHRRTEESLQTWFERNPSIPQTPVVFKLQMHTHCRRMCEAASGQELELSFSPPKTIILGS